MGQPETAVQAAPSVAVVAHLDRLTQTEALAAHTKAGYIAYDDGSLGAEGNHRRAWEWHRDHTTTTWSVVLEDDAVPVDDFTTQLEQAISAAPTPIVSLYLGRSRPPHWQGRIHQATEQADQADACFITNTHLLHAVGVAIHTHLLHDLTAVHTNYPADQHICWWARDRKHRISYTWPSLIDHQDGPTLIHHPDGVTRTPGRIAWRTGTRTHWTNTTVSMYGMG